MTREELKTLLDRVLELERQASNAQLEHLSYLFQAAVGELEPKWLFAAGQRVREVNKEYTAVCDQYDNAVGQYAIQQITGGEE